ncbi:hypothetical protein F4780DRAFT_483559 [Xylariomycetidae sp. FL0641]|nr:hypothetical protein F4780DRAFT_483559 [Xylariomycetidae sp. FL0641]
MRADVGLQVHLCLARWIFTFGTYSATRPMASLPTDVCVCQGGRQMNSFPRPGNAIFYILRGMFQALCLDNAWMAAPRATPCRASRLLAVPDNAATSVTVHAAHPLIAVLIRNVALGDGLYRLSNIITIERGSRSPARRGVCLRADARNLGGYCLILKHLRYSKARASAVESPCCCRLKQSNVSASNDIRLFRNIGRLSPWKYANRFVSTTNVPCIHQVSGRAPSF